jgi:hypothetical protein
MMAINIWNTFGLRTSPFFQEALDLNTSGLRPIDLFVGRADETEAVLRRLLGSDTGRLVIEGPAGVGKTTFIQHLKATVEGEHGFAVASEHCRVPHDLDATTLGVELLRSVLRSLRVALPPGRVEAIAGFERARKLVEDTERLAVQWHVSVLGSGGGVGGDRRSARSPFQPGQFHDALAELAASALGEGVVGIVVHLNNLENLEAAPTEAALLFRDARDYFLVPGLQIVLGATDGFSSRVLGVHAQVRSIFPTPIRLEPLGFEDIRQVLARRLEHLAIEGMQPSLPVTESLLREVFGLFRGDLRGMFGALDEACLQALGTLGSDPLDVDEARGVLAPLYRAQLRLDLSAVEIDHLVRLGRLGLREFRQADVVGPLGISQGRTSELMRALERVQAIVPTRRDGRSQYFALGGRAVLAYGLGE